MKEGGTSLNKTFREYNLVFKGLTQKWPIHLSHKCPIPIPQGIGGMMCTEIVMNAYVAVPCRNRRLFRCVFRSHCCVRSTVSLNFVKGGAHMRFIDPLDIRATTKRV